MSESAFDELNPMQAKFVLAYTDLSEGSETYGVVGKSAKAAGYSPKSCHVQGSQLLRNPKIQAAIQERKEQQQEQLRNEFLRGAKIGFKTLLEVMNDKDAPPAARVQASRDLLDRAGFKPTEKQEIKQESDGTLTIVFGDPDE